MEKNYQIVFAAKSCVQLQKAEMPQPSADSIVVKTEASLISTGTELTELESNVSEDSCWARSIKYPSYPGYSNVGRVVAVGANVDPSLLGKRVYSGGAHARYVQVAAEGIHVLGDNVKTEDAAFASIATVALGSVRIANVRMGEIVVVFGAGLIGQFVARFAQINGAIKVFVADVSDQRLDKLPDDPCFIKVNTRKENIVETIEKYNGGELADIVFETTSVPSLVEDELKCLAMNGKLIITSSPKGKSTVDLDFCSRRGLTIIGAHNWRVHTPVATPRDPWTRWRDSEYFLELLEKQQLSVSALITHREHYQNAVDVYGMLMKDRTQALGVILDWTDNKF